MLLKSGADTNLALSDGKTPLHISAESGTIAVFRHLLTNGADPWKQDKVGETALHKACRNAHHPLIKELLTHVKKLSSTNTQLEGFVRTKNEKGETALHCAAQMK